jgi:hypothetical protein
MTLELGHGDVRPGSNLAFVVAFFVCLESSGDVVWRAVATGLLDE